MLQRSVRDLRSRCESLGEALSEERGALAAVAAKAEALATRERDARGAETEATAEATGLAQKLAQVRVRTCTCSSSYGLVSSTLKWLLRLAHIRFARHHHVTPSCVATRR